jgi:hypothetical protein
MRRKTQHDLLPFELADGDEEYLAAPHGISEIGDCVPRTVSSEPCHAQLHGDATRQGNPIQLDVRNEALEAAGQPIRLGGQESLNHYQTPARSPLRTTCMNRSLKNNRSGSSAVNCQSITPFGGFDSSPSATGYNSTRFEHAKA